MAIQERTKREKTAKKDWLWSVQPLVTWFKWLGVDLINDNHTESRRWWFVFYHIFCLLMIFAVEILCLNDIFRNLKKVSNVYVSDEEFNTDTFAWNSAIDYTNFAIHSTGTHLVLISVIRARWRPLVKAFQRLQPFFNDDLFARVRKASILGILYVIILHAGLCFIIANYLQDKDAPFKLVFFPIFSVLTQIYPITTLALFVVISYSSSHAFQVIHVHLIWLRKEKMDPGYYERLSALKNYHILVCEVVDHINNTFGWILIISLPFHFVASVTSSFYLFGNKTETITIMEILFFVSPIFQLLVICCAADLIPDQVNNVSRELIQMQIELIEPIKSLASSFLVQVDLFLPQISALGFLNVNKKFLPQVVATTLTYFFILYQFQSSEFYGQP